MLDSLESGIITTETVLGNIPEKRKVTAEDVVTSFVDERIFNNLRANINGGQGGDRYGVYLSTLINKPIILPTDSQQALRQSVEKAKNNLLDEIDISEITEQGSSRVETLLASILNLKMQVPNGKVELSEFLTNYIKNALIWADLTYWSPSTLMTFPLLNLHLDLDEENELKDSLIEDFNNVRPNNERSKINDAFCDDAIGLASLHKLLFSKHDQLAVPGDPLFEQVKELLSNDPSNFALAFHLTVLSAKDACIDSNGIHLVFDTPTESNNNQKPIERKF